MKLDSVQFNYGHLATMVTLQLRQLLVHPGQRISLQDVMWSEFEAILEELGDHRASRIALSKGILELRMPLPKHEKAKALIGDMVKILLEELNLESECFGSSTFKRPDMAQGLEPDECFYIEHAAQMIGKDRVDLLVDPPPDLAIEVDVTSKTSLEAYQGLGVPELWRFEAGQLRISLLTDGEYRDSEQSQAFPQLAIAALIAAAVEQAQTQGRTSVLKAFRARVQAELGET